MQQEEFDKLLDRYLKGEASRQEERWFDDFFESYQKSETSWSSFESERTRLEIFSKVRQRIRQASFENHRAKSLWPAWLKVAAMLLVALGMSWFIIGYRSSRHEPTMITQVTTRGQKATLVLPDGTNVRLNAESTLIYPEEFEKNRREVTLSGEGFFEVAKNPDKPFVVRATDFSTQVLGTAFNVSAYRETEHTVTVREGKVQVMWKEDTTASVIVHANEQAVLSSEGLFKKQVDIHRYISWKDGVIYLDHTSLEEMAQVLERWYDVKIIFEHPGLKKCTISGKFSNDQLINILKSVRFIKKIDFTFKDKQTIVLRGKPC